MKVRGVYLLRYQSLSHRFNTLDRVVLRGVVVAIELTFGMLDVMRAPKRPLITTLKMAAVAAAFCTDRSRNEIIMMILVTFLYPYPRVDAF